MPIGDATPAGNDAVWVELRTQKQLLQQLFALASGGKNIATAVQTGLGTLAGSGTTWAGPVASPSTITAASDISSSGTASVAGVFKNIAAYSNPITTSFRNLFVTSVDGQYGFNLSSREFKQDVQSALVDPKNVLLLRLVTYRYIAAVEEYGDAAAIEHGLLAEEVEEAGLGWLVDYGEDGKPLTLKFHLIAMALLPVVQDLNARVTRLEASN